MKRKIGEIFELGGEWYQCVVGNSCEVCIFNNKKCYTFVSDGDPIGYCIADRRKDNKNVIFKKLEKVGEPILFGNKIMQRYKVFVTPYISKELGYFNIKSRRDLTILIEIKQNKEDMEEKKIQHYDCFFDGKSSKSNLKPFDLNAAKAGKPVCTRDGRKARIICFDLKNEEYPIVAAIGNDSSETLLCYTINGEIIKGNYKSDKDLMMLPEKRKGWINIHQYDVYKTKEEAEAKIFDKANYLTTIEIEYWR